ncbi:hypothetical protein ACVMGC_005516 [Bradyrhizobium barranii subsp. barranii]
MTAQECLEALKNQKLKRIDDLPNAVGVYALADHLGEIHYIGITEADSFRDRIYSRHVNGSEERSHKLACNYNIGRMWRDRKSADHVPYDAQVAKDLRREFIRRHCRAACIPFDFTKRALEQLEQEILAIAPPDMISWNATRMRVNRLPEPMAARSRRRGNSSSTAWAGFPSGVRPNPMRSPTSSPTWPRIAPPRSTALSSLSTAAPSRPSDQRDSFTLGRAGLAWTDACYGLIVSTFALRLRATVRLWPECEARRVSGKVGSSG